MLEQNLIENPPFIEAKYYHKGRLKPVELIVIHTMESPQTETVAKSVAIYFQNIGVQASAHYCIDDNEIIQCVYDKNTAWHCKNANANGIGLEHAGFCDTIDWESDYSISMLENSAQLSAYLCKKFDIPIQKATFKADNDPTVIDKGFCGHKEVPLHGSHYDPGKNFPFDYYFELINKFLNEAQADRH